MKAVPQTLADPTTIEEIAGLTDEEAIRRRFDAHNARYIAAVSVLFVLAGAVMTIVYWVAAAGLWKPVVATLNFAVSFFMAYVFGQLHLAETRHRPTRPFVRLIARSLGDWIVTLFPIHYATYILLTPQKAETTMTWAMTYPWILLGLRLSVRRRLTLHLIMVAVSVLAVQLVTDHQGQPPEAIYIGSTVLNTFVFLVGTFNSRRVRRGVIAFWAGRRDQAREQLRMRDELRLARDVQLSMLPDAPPSVPWVDIAARSLPATEVGGDYYEYFQVGERLAVVCSDVAGHGLASGIVLATVRSGFTLLRESLSDPAAVLSRLHDLVAHTTRRRMLATAAVVLLDPTTRRARIASAGHPPVIVASNGSVRSIELFAPPLGVRLPVRIAQTDLPFKAGDYFILHSDGIYESRSSSGETYGMERLERVVAAQHGASAAAMRDAILDDVNEFRSGAAQDDDATVVVLRVV